MKVNFSLDKQYVRIWLLGIFSNVYATIALVAPKFNRLNLWMVQNSTVRMHNETNCTVKQQKSGTYIVPYTVPTPLPTTLWQHACLRLQVFLNLFVWLQMFSVKCTMKTNTVLCLSVVRQYYQKELALINLSLEWRRHTVFQANRQGHLAWIVFVYIDHYSYFKEWKC